jgi:esterase/lipase
VAKEQSAGLGLSVVGDWARKYPLAPRWRRDERLRLRTLDGVDIFAGRLRGPADAPATVVLAHGFLNSSRSPMVHAFARLLAGRVNVIAPDLRGHGASGGQVTLGALEPYDIDAAVTAARETFGVPVVTVGTSLGGVAVLRHAGLIGGVAGVVAISAPGWKDLHGREGARRLNRFVASRAGRQAAARLLRTRVGPLPPFTEMSEALAHIAPAFCVIVHAADDIYFGEEHARSLYEWASEPKELWWLDGGGHGGDLLTPELADRLFAEVIPRAAVQ